MWEEHYPIRIRSISTPKQRPLFVAIKNWLNNNSYARDLFALRITNYLNKNHKWL
jgi:hypothetical protein